MIQMCIKAGVGGEVLIWFPKANTGGVSGGGWQGRDAACGAKTRSVSMGAVTDDPGRGRFCDL